MIQAMALPAEIIKRFKTAIFASAVSAGLILIILLIRPAAVSGFRAAFETVFFGFPSGVAGATIYIWLAAKFLILGKVARTNLAATLKALIIVVPLVVVLSLAGIALGAPPDAQVWIFLEILLSCIISDAAYAPARRKYEYK